MRILPREAVAGAAAVFAAASARAFDKLSTAISFDSVEVQAHTEESSWRGARNTYWFQAMNPV
jgi:hypothetical protein